MMNPEYVNGVFKKYGVKNQTHLRYLLNYFKDKTDNYSITAFYELNTAKNAVGRMPIVYYTTPTVITTKEAS